MAYQWLHCKQAFLASFEHLYYDLLRVYCKFLRQKLREGVLNLKFDHPCNNESQKFTVDFFDPCNYSCKTFSYNVMFTRKRVLKTSECLLRFIIHWQHRKLLLIQSFRQRLVGPQWYQYQEAIHDNSFICASWFTLICEKFDILCSGNRPADQLGWSKGFS